MGTDRDFWNPSGHGVRDFARETDSKTGLLRNRSQRIKRGSSLLPRGHLLAVSDRPGEERETTFFLKPFLWGEHRSALTVPLRAPLGSANERHG